MLVKMLGTQTGGVVCTVYASHAIFMRELLPCGSEHGRMLVSQSCMHPLRGLIVARTHRSSDTLYLVYTTHLGPEPIPLALGDSDSGTIQSGSTVTLSILLSRILT